MKKYSLANYILSVDPNDSSIKSMFGTISIGGEGNAIGSISLSVSSSMWSTEGYATGAWIHNKNLDKHGSVTISINQLSDKVVKLIQLVKLYYGKDYDGFTLAVSDINGNKVASCIDCYIEKIPEQSFGTTASDQRWTFTCGQINFN